MEDIKKNNEIANILIAIIILTIVLGFTNFYPLNSAALGNAILFAAIATIIPVLAKKAMAYNLDASVEHELWRWSRYGFPESWSAKKPIPIGVILPLFVTAFSLGTLKLGTILTYETSALKRRAARKFGHYSFTEMIDWHIALIGAAGTISLFAISIISYFIPGLEGLPSVAAFVAFFNLIPLSKLDGAQIFFGSRTLWAVLGTISLILVSYVIILT